MAGLAILLALFLVAGASGAMSAEDLGPRIGSAAPPIGELPDANGKAHSLASLMGEKGLVLLFHRSAEWCPYCQAQLIDLNSRHADMVRRGYALAAISYDAPDKLRAFVERREIRFTLLSDQGSEIIGRYGLRDPAYAQGHRAYGVPRPIILVLDRAGTIKAKLFEESYRQRPPASLVVEALDRIAAGSD
jgi:peroxiredoxin